MPEELLPEDYTEPRCLLDTSVYKNGGRTAHIPVGRIINKLDEHMGSRDYESAERHLLYWLEEARADGDDHGELTVVNELMGFYRKTNRREEAYRYAELGLSMVDGSGRDGSVVSATTYINAATVYKTFDDAERAYPLFCRAREIYEAKLAPGDKRLGGLYNNMALVLADLGKYGEARELYRRAIDVMIGTERGGIEAAISYMNMANAVEAELGLEDASDEIEECLACAEALLEAEDVRGKYYAYVCERCAPGFSYYGWFAYADELTARAESIYAGA